MINNFLLNNPDLFPIDKQDTSVLPFVKDISKSNQIIVINLTNPNYFLPGLVEGHISFILDPTTQTSKNLHLTFRLPKAWIQDTDTFKINEVPVMHIFWENYDSLTDLPMGKINFTSHRYGKKYYIFETPYSSYTIEQLTLVLGNKPWDQIRESFEILGKPAPSRDSNNYIKSILKYQSLGNFEFIHIENFMTKVFNFLAEINNLEDLNQPLTDISEKNIYKMISKLEL